MCLASAASEQLINYLRAAQDKRRVKEGVLVAKTKWEIIKEDWNHFINGAGAAHKYLTSPPPPHCITI